MPDLLIRPSIKLVKAQYTVVLSAIAVFFFIFNRYFRESPDWILLLPLLLLVWPLRSHIQRRSVRLRISEETMRYEAGLLSKSVWTVQLAKIQDVQVDQRFWQRLAGIGNVSIRTASERDAVLVEGLEDPHTVADRILKIAGERAEKQSKPSRRQ
jgi:uncharacterized membrane protein YdbT with pleckstrin-like domain